MLVGMGWMEVGVGYLFSVCGVIQHYVGLCVFMFKSTVGFCVFANNSFFFFC